MSENVTIPNLSMVVDRVMNKNVKMLDTAENGFAIQVCFFIDFFLGVVIFFVAGFRQL